MTLSHAAITLDCTDVAKVVAFWSAALGRPVAPKASQYFAMLEPTGPTEVPWLFLAVPEGKTAKNRMHVDFHSTDRPTEVARLVELGAQWVGDYDEWGTHWTTLRDVEGNEFCVADPPAGTADDPTTT